MGPAHEVHAIMLISICCREAYRASRQYAPIRRLRKLAAQLTADSGLGEPQIALRLMCIGYAKMLSSSSFLLLRHG